MRVSTSMIYTSAMRNTATALERYYDLTEQNASMKRINRPSDDPVGTDAVLGLRDHVARLEQYRENVGTAQGWLGAADAALADASELIISTMELSEQAATGTLSAEQRDMIAAQARENMESMIGLANTEFSGKSVFAGQAVDENAYATALFADVRDLTLDQDAVIAVSGSAESSVWVEFTDSGDVGGAADLGYRYSTDGGQTWTTETLASGDTELDLGTCRMELDTGSSVTAETGDGQGTRFTIRPAAVYVGDADDGASVRHYGSSQVAGEASGNFSQPVAVRVDTDGDVTGTISYSYSTDGGNTWTSGNTAQDGLLAVPGGYLELVPDPATAVSAGDQFVITPDTASVTMPISETGEIEISTVGLDAFGGLYQADGTATASPADGANLLETMGRLIGALETNDIETISQCLEDLEAAHSELLAVEASVGARENRLEAADSLLETRIDTDTERISALEDVDITELLIELESTEAIYKSVVETSSTIMGMSLINYT